MRFFLLINFFVVNCLICFSSYAQTSLEQNSSAPTMLISEPGMKEMQLVELEVNAIINQAFAETSMTMTFHNPNDRPLAGDLVFPLPDGALVSGYALDINGVMVDGSVVKKNKARRVLETEVRKGVDPGLIEYTQGNNYRTRVFPIPAKGVRVVRVSYVNNLSLNQSHKNYHLPLGFNAPLEKFKLNIDALNTKTPPTLIGSQFNDLAFKKADNYFSASIDINDVILSNPINVIIDQVETNPVSIEQANDGQYYFTITHKVSAPGEKSSYKSPNKISVIWDASGSRKTVNHQKELDILKGYLTRLSKESPRKRTVYLSVLRHTLSKPKKFKIVDGDSHELINYIEQIQYDGGTQLSVLNDQKKPLKKADLHLIFTDGLSNFGEPYQYKLRSPATIISEDSRSDHNLLRSIASSTGGDYINVVTLKNQQVIEAIGSSKYAYHSSQSEQGEVSDVVPVVSGTFGQYLVFSGKLNTKQGKLTLNFNNAGKKQSHTYSLDQSTAINGRLLRTVWAQSKVNDLLTHDRDNHQALLELGQTYSLVTPQTSLLVLETLEQYVEHQITPPDSLPEMQAEYDYHLAGIALDQQEESDNKLERIIKKWHDRVQWWNTDFPVKAKVQKKTSSYDADESIVTEARTSIEPTDSDEAERIIVTGTRATIQSSIDQKTISTEIIDGLSADEIGDIPALSIGEALETITGASSFSDNIEYNSNNHSSIKLQAWDPDTPYLKALKSVSPQERVTTYFKLRSDYNTSIPFFLDCAEFFYQNNNPVFALQVLSNITELDLDNPAVNRIVAHRLRQAKKFHLSQLLFEEVIRLRPEEPQSYRDLAFVFAEQGQYGKAIELLYNVILKKWDNRFEGIELVALNELNQILVQAPKKGVDTSMIDPRLIKQLDLDIRIVMSWDADLTDIDLHVIEPNGEEAYYENDLTNIGGLVSDDFTQGYGPEEYLLKKADNGLYQIKAKYYSNSSSSAIGPVTVQLDIYTHYGRENERHQATTIQLTESGDDLVIGDVRF